LGEGLEDGEEAEGEEEEEDGGGDGFGVHEARRWWLS
jgi:hypothetical protein